MLPGQTLRFILLTGNSSNMRTFGKNQERYYVEKIRYKGSGNYFQQLHEKTDVSTFSECSFLPESQDSETCLTIDPILY